jgi:ABC-type sugar transport system ATPase subunit
MNLIKGTYADGIVHLPGENKFRVPEAWKVPLAQRLTTNEVIVGFRPEAARVAVDAPLNSTVYTVDLHGAYNVLHVNLNGGNGDVGDIQHLRASRDVVHPINAPVRFDIDPEMVRFFDPASQAAIPLPLSAPALAPSSVEVLQ